MTKLKLVKPLKDYSFEIDSEDDLLKAFSIKDQKKLVLPSKFVYPLRTPYYFTWTSPEGHYVYLVFKKPQWSEPRGAVFRRGKPLAGPTSSMCDWCHSFGSSDEIGMLLTSLTDRKTIGMMLCLDLTCIDKTETIALIAGKNFERLADKICDDIAVLFEATAKAE